MVGVVILPEKIINILLDKCGFVVYNKEADFGGAEIL